ncbi:MAG: hypothetical protein JSW66_17330 [Phycisphaerales bacterium]|nr:MAG: hypothetical protein JSW66_17330 [Phycisphaerales bacterium]
MKTGKAHDSTTALVILTIALIVGCLLFRSRFSASIFLDTPEQRAQQRRILLLYHTDHEALLKAGREILRQGPKDPMNYQYLGPMHIDGFPVPGGVCIPKVIRKLRPHASLINFNGFVVLQMRGGIGDFGVRIYPEGFAAPRRYFRYGNRELLGGLWYYDYEYNHHPEYDKRIDEIIRTGRWEEPNNTDLSGSSN